MAKITPITMNLKYGALRTLITVLYILAGALVFVGLVTQFGINHDSPLSIIPLVACVIFAFNFVVMAQIISVFIDMEWNQRETNELLEQVIKNLPEPKAE